MTIIKEARCNGPKCESAYSMLDMLDRDIIPAESGWYTVTIGHASWHFCSLSCIAMWGLDRVNRQSTSVGQVGVPKDGHGTKMHDSKVHWPKDTDGPR